MIMIGIVTLFATIQKVRKVIIMFDIFTKLHNYIIDKKMWIKKTELGGLFSVAFAVVAIMFFLINTLEFLNGNIFEDKALVPTITMEKLDSVNAKDFIISLSLRNYGGEC